MQFLILGLAALVVALIVLRGFTVANPAVMARQLKLAGGVLALLAAVVFFVRGGINQALVLGLIGAWLLGWRGLGSWGGFPGGFPGSARKSPGQSSRVTTDHLEIGRIHARQLERLCPDGAHVLYVQGPADASAAILRRQGMEEALRGRPYELKVLNGEWTAASAEKAISGWLRLRTADLFQPGVIVCQNDLMARGARAALDRLRPEWARLPFLGCDGLPRGGRLDVDEGRLAATVTMPSCASPAIELVVKWMRSGAVPPAETVLAPSPYPAP
jgi:hypothetical protein